MKPRHPGKIAYFEIRNGQETLTHTDPIDGVPESFQFHESNGKMVPVVKVVAIMDEKGRPREITEYGPKGERLRTTLAPPSR